ncbi:jg21479 [Pararge aegeria aegeria]|uniref:Jg21479 protein n=1 Tax=Pararge aegeria aegeria TaxID=348720 RepID=A0A8S4RP64_9NEOP|nr:jg21479 [Pararge aegeria aegeria]
MPRCRQIRIQLSPPLLFLRVSYEATKDEGNVTEKGQQRPVLERDSVRLYWDRSIITDRTILANKPDIVINDRAQSSVFLVDITIRYDKNLVRAETEKKRKYLDLSHEIIAMWHVEYTEIILICTNWYPS